MQLAQTHLIKISYPQVWYHLLPSFSRNGKLLYISSHMNMIRMECTKSSREICDEDSRCSEKSTRVLRLAIEKTNRTRMTIWSKRLPMASCSWSRILTGSRSPNQILIQNRSGPTPSSNPSEMYSNCRKQRAWETVESDLVSTLYCTFETQFEDAFNIED